MSSELGERPRRGRFVTPGMITVLAAVTAIASASPAVAASPVAAQVSVPVAVPVAAKTDAALLAQVDTGRTATFYVLLKGHPDLAAATRDAPRGERAGRVLRATTAFAERSQSGVRRMLGERHSEYTPYWIANAIKVTGDKTLVAELAGRPDVDQIVPDRTYPLIQPVATEAAASAGAGVEWNIDRIGAPKVWSAYGDRGEGVVVGTIDTGAQFDHPAIARQYRGATADGSPPDNDYNWFDPSRTCGGPAAPPCDNVGHGTHVLGTILGDDGQGNQVGVAPGAKWIAAKGCESSSCSLESLLAAGQWMLAPTDVNGADPRPDLAPDVINNSWGGSHGDPFYQQIVDAWKAAGIVGVFAAGNSGPACATANSPGDYGGSLAVGASDGNDAIAGFSSRGPGGVQGEVKPDLAAPGVGVRSSLPGGGYGLLSGTSMAAPHVTGTVALAMSAAPGMRRDVAATVDLLNDTTVPMPDATCGGTDRDNNIWGHGRLDAFMAVTKAPRGPVGALGGVVSSGEAPVAGATVEVLDVIPRTVTTDAQGRYLVGALPVGQVRVTVTAFGYLTRTVSATVTADEKTIATHDLDLSAAPRFTLSGRVTDDTGRPVSGAVVSLPGTPVPPVTADADGGYQVSDLPGGTYDLLVEGGRCRAPQRPSLTVASSTARDVVLAVRSDGRGHVCDTASPNWIEADTVLPLAGDDAYAEVSLPFPVEFYDQTYAGGYVATNGYLSFTTPAAFFSNGPVPGNRLPGASVFAFWDDLVVDSAASVRTATTGTAPDRSFVVEWRDVGFYGDPGVRVSFEVILAESGSVTVQYRGTGAGARAAGGSASVGIQDEVGLAGIGYSYNEPVLSDGVAVVFHGG